MMFRRAMIALSLVAMAGCEQASQTLPFEPETGETVSRIVGPDGGTVSTPAGLSLRFDAGAFERATEVTVFRRSGADVGAAVNGEIVPGTVFDVGPSGTALGLPAHLALKVPASTLDTVNPLSLTAVLVSGAERRYLSDASVDLGAAILRTEVPRLGTVALRVSHDVIAVGSSGGVRSDPAPWVASHSSASVAPAGLAARTTSLSMACGVPGTPDCSTTDAIAITLSEELYDALDGCVQFIDPVVTADLSLAETPGEATTGLASGTVAFSGTLRYRTGSGSEACGDGTGAVQSVAVDETFSVGGPDGDPTPFTYDAGNGTVTFERTSDGAETLDCDCGADIFEAGEIRVGQTSEAITFEGLSGQVTWALRLDR